MRGTRYHEAGHDVAAYHHGYLITGVTVTDTECVATYRSPYPSPEFGGWGELWREACITMAGLLADQRAMWGEMRPEPCANFLADAKEAVESEAELHVDDLPPDDHSTLLRLLRQMGDGSMGDDPAKYYRLVVESSGQLVSDHWTEIDAVARALEQNAMLDGPEVVRIIERTV
jgi:hypothetical protein